MITCILYFILVIRATVPKLNLDDVFEQKNEVAKAVEDQLEKVTLLNHLTVDPLISMTPFFH